LHSNSSVKRPQEKKKGGERHSPGHFLHGRNRRKKKEKKKKKKKGGKRKRSANLLKSFLDQINSWILFPTTSDEKGGGKGERRPGRRDFRRKKKKKKGKEKKPVFSSGVSKGGEGLGSRLNFNIINLETRKGELPAPLDCGGKER